MAKPSLGIPQNLSPKTLIALIVTVILLVAVAPGYYFYMQYQKTQKMLENPSVAAKEEVAAVVEQISKLMLLPKDEQPTLATVSDKTKLQNQTFFAHAENGDKVLIFPKAKKAYLYRPSINKIIDVASVNIGSQANLEPVVIAPSVSPKISPSPSIAKATPSPTLSASSGQASAFKSVNVALYNGTRTAGLAATTENTLKTKAPNVTVIAKGNAANNYTETLVIDFTGKFTKEAQELAKLTNGSIGVLPKGEIKPTADILVILGPQ